MYSVYQWCFGIGVAGSLVMAAISAILGAIGGGSGDVGADASAEVTPDITPDFSFDSITDASFDFSFDGSSDISSGITTEFAADSSIALESGAAEYNAPDFNIDFDSYELQHNTDSSAGAGGSGGVMKTFLLFLPFSPLSALSAALLFGTAGLLSHSTTIHLPLAIIFGLAGCALCNALMRKLKNAKNVNVRSNDFVWKVGVLTMEIGVQGYGEVQFPSIAGATTFTARHEGPVRQGALVVSTGFVDGEMWVKPVPNDIQARINS